MSDKVEVNDEPIEPVEAEETEPISSESLEPDSDSPQSDQSTPESATIEIDESAAWAAYRARMEALGGRFAEDGTFIGFGNPVQELSTQRPTDNGSFNGSYQSIGDIDPGETLDKKFEALRNDIISTLKPERVTGGLERVMAAEPHLKPYRETVEKMLDQLAPEQINDAVIRALCYYTRGMAADVEVAKALKAERDKFKTVVGSVATSASNGPGGASGGRSKTHAQVTPIIEEYAKEWGLDPQKLADKLAEEVR